MGNFNLTRNTIGKLKFKCECNSWAPGAQLSLACEDDGAHAPRSLPRHSNLRPRIGTATFSRAFF